jgi:hypothetical protein
VVAKVLHQAALAVLELRGRVITVVLVQQVKNMVRAAAVGLVL